MITVTITSDDLAKHHACDEGLDLFNTLYPSGIASIEWNAENQVQLIRSGDQASEFIQWLREDGLLPMYSLRNANLRYADLHYADLRYADLRNANLRDAYLYNSDCRGTDFTGANLHGADLSNIITDELTKGLPSCSP